MLCNKLAVLYNNLAVLYNNLAVLYNNLAVLYNNLAMLYNNLAMLYNNLAVLYNNQSKYNEAELLHQQALTTREKVLGPDGIISINFSFSYFLVPSIAVKESASLLCSVTITFVIKEVFQAHPWPCLLVD